MPQTPAAKPAPPVPPQEFREADIATAGAAALIAIVQDSQAPEFKKAKACVRLGELGAREAVPALAALLADPHLSVYARYGLEPIAGPEPDEALRAALAKLKGTALIGAVNSLGKRRDGKAVPALVKMMHGADVELARAAASAIGNIGTPAAAKDLQAALPKTAGLLRMAVADAALACADRFVAEGHREQGLALYTALSAADIPKPMRLAAMNGIIREETSVSRPR